MKKETSKKNNILLPIISFILGMYIVALSTSGAWNFTPTSPFDDDLNNAGRIMQSLFGTGETINDEDPWGNEIKGYTGGGIFARIEYIQDLLQD